MQSNDARARSWSGFRRGGKAVAVAALAVATFAPAGLAAASDFDDYVAVKVGRLIVGNGEVREGATILILDGKIEAIGSEIELPHPCKIVDASEATAMPGFIHAASRLGLLTYRRQNQSRADLRVADEFLPEKEAYEEALEAGFTTLGLVPPGSTGIPGRGMVIRTADLGNGLVLVEDSSVAVNQADPGKDKAKLKAALKSAQAEIDKIEKARKEWEAKKKAAEEAAAKKAEEEKKKKDAEPKKDPPKPKEDGKSYQEEQPKPKKEEKKNGKKDEVGEFEPPAVKPELQPFVDMLQEKEGAFAHVRLGNASSYLHFRDALGDYEIPYVLTADLMSSGGFFSRPIDLFLVADQLGENEELIGVTPHLSNLPYSRDKTNVTRALLEAGARVAFVPANPFQLFSDENDHLEAMRYRIGELIKAGVSEEDAIRGMTLHAAELLGLEDRLGSVEKGKDANLVLLTGDPFDVQSEVDKVLIEGVVVFDREDDS